MAKLDILKKSLDINNVSTQFNSIAKVNSISYHSQNPKSQNAVNDYFETIIGDSSESGSSSSSSQMVSA